jgi:hypothetical protein
LQGFCTYKKFGKFFFVALHSKPEIILDTFAEGSKPYHF